MFKVLISAVSLVTLVGCATGARYTINTPGPVAPQIHVIDSRTDLSKKGGKPKLFSHFYYHGDSAFSPTKLELFRAAVAESFPHTPTTVVLHKFDVVDSFARRVRAAQAAGMASISYAIAIGLDAIPTDSDFIMCAVQATVDGKRISTAASAPYREKAWGVSVFRDPSYVVAVNASVTEALAKWIEQARASSK